MFWLPPNHCKMGDLGVLFMCQVTRASWPLPSHQPVDTSRGSSTVLGRPPLIQCVIGCNSHPTIPNSFKDDRRLESASADTQLDWGNGSRLYEVYIWM